MCPYSNFLRAIPVPDKTATTAGRALLHEVLLPFGFPTVMQSDRGGEWLNAVMHRLTFLLSIEQVFTSGFRPRLNGATERVHRFLNSVIGIYCEKFQNRWEDYLQPAVYAHNTSPISGFSDITPFFLVFGRDAPCPETKMVVAHKQFSEIKSDLRRRQRELYDSAARDLHIPDGKIVYLRKDHVSSLDGQATRFIRNFEGPFLVTGHPYNRSDLLSLWNAITGQGMPRPVNVEKVVVVPEQFPDDIRIPGNAIIELQPQLHNVMQRAGNPDLGNVAHEFGKYLATLPNKSTVSSQACKLVYEHYPAACEIVKSW